MSRVTVPLALIFGSVAVGTAAWATSWEDFSAAYPKFPCQDGWMGCIVDGAALSPDLQGVSIPGPADLRVGWDLNPTGTFSPFGHLSPYAGSATAAVSASAPPPEEASAGEGSAVEVTAAEQSPKSVSARVLEAPGGSPVSPSSTPAVSNTRPSGMADIQASSLGSGSPAPAAAVGSSGSSVRPGGGAATAAGTAAPTGTSERLQTANSLSGSVRPSSGGSAPAGSTGTASGNSPTLAPAGAIQATNAAVAVVGTDSCDNLAKLEPQAMLGKLSDGLIGCLEKSYAAAPKQTEKNKISRVLMANAYSKGDTASWEKLMKRHLEEIDQSDPDLCYKYAMHLSKGGVGRSAGVIKWANAALENRTVWTGDTYSTRVSSLYKLRAASAQSQWKSAEDENAKSPTESSKKRVEETRNQTKVLSREWYEYLKAAGKDTTIAMQLCVSAAGTKDYCEGG